MNKDLILKKEDMVYYLDKDNDPWSLLICDNDGKTIKEFEDVGDRKIIKVERTQTIYEYKEILDEKEKEYLSAVIKPFRSNVRYIRKCESGWLNEEFIIIVLKEESISLPCFKKGTMYKRMTTYKEYTIEELNL